MRQDYRVASLGMLLANLNRDPKKPAYKLEDFLLTFGPKEPKEQYTRGMQISMIKAIAQLYSAKNVQDKE